MLICQLASLILENKQTYAQCPTQCKKKNVVYFRENITGTCKNCIYSQTNICPRHIITNLKMCNTLL